MTSEGIYHDLDADQAILIILHLDELNHEFHDRRFVIPERFAVRKPIDEGEKSVPIPLWESTGFMNDTYMIDVVFDECYPFLITQNGDQGGYEDPKVLVVESIVLVCLCGIPQVASYFVSTLRTTRRGIPNSTLFRKAKLTLASRRCAQNTTHGRWYPTAGERYARTLRRSLDPWQKC